jgi:aspartate-semialdehyde dehydrogenase
LAERPLVAVVGGDTLLAREVREVLGESKPAPRVELISASTENSTVLAKEEDEAIVMSPLTAESLTGAKAAFLAGSPASSRRALKTNPEGGPVLIDLTGALEDQPSARLRAPSAEASRPEASAIQVIAHPAAIAVTRLLSMLAPIRRAIVHVFEPASERGQRGLDELQQQTVAALSFQKMKKDVFDTQAAFNMLAQYGEEAEESLDSIEQRIERHLASLLSGYPSIPMPSLRVVQAPVFHGHSISLWIEFEENPGTEKISEKLIAAGIDFRADEAPNNVGIAGQTGIAVGAVAEDRNDPRAVWIWAVADNLKVAAENAVAVAREVM